MLHPQKPVGKHSLHLAIHGKIELETGLVFFSCFFYLSYQFIYLLRQGEQGYPGLFTAFTLTFTEKAKKKKDVKDMTMHLTAEGTN